MIWYRLGILATNCKIQKLMVRQILRKRSSNKYLLEFVRIVRLIHLDFILKSINEKCYRFEHALFLSEEKG